MIHPAAAAILMFHYGKPPFHEFSKTHALPKGSVTRSGNRGIVPQVTPDEKGKIPLTTRFSTASENSPPPIVLFVRRKFLSASLSCIFSKIEI